MFLYFSPQVVNALMMLFNVVVPKEQLYKCMACVENDRMFYIKVNFDQPLDAAGRSD